MKSKAVVRNQSNVHSRVIVHRDLKRSYILINKAAHQIHKYTHPTDCRSPAHFARDVSEVGAYDFEVNILSFGLILCATLSRLWIASRPTFNHATAGYRGTIGYSRRHFGIGRVSASMVLAGWRSQSISFWDILNQMLVNGFIICDNGDSREIREFLALFKSQGPWSCFSRSELRRGGNCANSEHWRCCNTKLPA
jgi:hypothetical protein